MCMIKSKYLILAAIVVGSLFCFSCSKKKGENLKSPCTSAQGGPCDERINPNFEWMKRIS